MTPQRRNPNPAKLTYSCDPIDAIHFVPLIILSNYVNSHLKDETTEGVSKLVCSDHEIMTFNVFELLTENQ